MQDKSPNAPNVSQQEGSKQEHQISKNELPELNKVTGGSPTVKVNVRVPNVRVPNLTIR